MDFGAAALAWSLLLLSAGAVGGGIFRLWSRHEQEMTRIRQTRRVTLDDSAQSEFDALRQEIAQLRDTTTQYDLSVERSMEELRRRMATVENGRIGSSANRPTIEYSASSAAAGEHDQEVKLSAGAS